jgi:hypothetical protein
MPSTRSHATVPLAAALLERVEQDLPALAQCLAHLGREIEVGLEAEGARDVVHERALDRDDVDDVQTGHAPVRALGHPQPVVEGGRSVLGPVESDEDALDHRSHPPPAI